MSIANITIADGRMHNRTDKNWWIWYELKHKNTPSVSNNK